MDVLGWFYELCKIPRRSGEEQKVCEWLCGFARERSLEHYSDNLYNVIIKKPGSPGASGEPVVLQGHTDMVCASAPGCLRHPEVDGVAPVRDGDWLRADGTTLGADNGIAVAIMLAILDSDEIAHPPLECVFTTQEETGLKGAQGIDTALIRGRRMINLDSEEDGVATVSCAGGKRMRLSRRFAYEKVAGAALVCNISGLRGGHSGMEIGFERVNAIKLAGQLLGAPSKNGRLCDFWGGEADNSIARMASVTLVYPDEERRAAARQSLEQWTQREKRDLAGSEPELSFTFEELPQGEYLCPDELTADLFERLVTLAPTGVRARNPEMGGFVVASENIGIAGVDQSGLYLVISLRSSDERIMRTMSDEIETLADTLIFDCESGSEYPGWKYSPQSPLRDVVCGAYRDLFGEELRCEAIHAGLECGIFAERLPGLDALAIGPTLTGCHTPQEALYLPSVERITKLVRTALERLAGSKQ